MSDPAVLTPFQIKRGADLQEQIQALKVELAGISGANPGASATVYSSEHEISVRRKMNATKIARTREALTGKIAERDTVLHPVGPPQKL